MAIQEKNIPIAQTLYFGFTKTPWFRDESQESQTLTYFTLNKLSLVRHDVLVRTPDGMITLAAPAPKKGILKPRYEFATLVGLTSFFDAFIKQNIIEEPPRSFILSPHDFLMNLARRHRIADVLSESQAHLFMNAMIKAEDLNEIDEYE